MWHIYNIMAESSFQQEVHLSVQGRLVIPAQLRRALGFEAGDVLVARSEEGRLIIEKAEVIKQRLKARFAATKKRSLADELIKERREEAKRDTQS